MNGSNQDKGMPQLKPQPHGGALLSGGAPGHAGGSGRPKSEIRRKARELHEKYLDRLEKTLEKDDLSPGEISKAVDVTGKYGMGEAAVTLDDDTLLPLINLYTAKYFKEIGNAEAYDGWIRGLAEVVRDA